MDDSGASSLRQITDRLEQLAAELGGEQDEERAAKLVREASKLAAEAGRAAEQVLRESAEDGGEGLAERPPSES